MTKKHRKTNRKSKRATQPQQNHNLVAIALIVGALILGGVVVAMSGSNTGETTVTSSNDGNTVAEASWPQDISPNSYMSDFVENDTEHFLLDVRTPGEFNSGHINGAANINVEELARRLDDVPSDQPIILYCRSGNRSAQAARILTQAGYTNVYDLGGIIDWQAAGYNLE